MNPATNPIFQLAVAQHQQGHLVEAERLYIQLMGSVPANFELHYMVALLYHQQGRTAAALSAIESALTLSPLSAPALGLHGVLLLMNERPRDALVSFSRAVESNPADSQSWFNRGVILAQMGDKREAITAFDRALKGPLGADAWNNRGAALLDLGQFAEALDSFDAALKLSPGHSNAIANRGLALMELKQYEKAIAVFDGLLSRSPDEADVWVNRGTALQEIHKLTDAIDSYTKAIILHPHNARAWNNRASALRSEKRYTETLSDLDHALAISPDHLEAWLNRGLILQTMNRFDEALASFDKALEIDPHFWPAITPRAWLLCEMGDIAGGITLLGQRKALARPAPDTFAHNPHRQKHDEEQRAYLSAASIKSFPSGATVMGSAVNKGAAESAAMSWQASHPQIAVIDDFLSAASLEELRQFCWGSSAWRRPYPEGYLGAVPEDGFCCPLLAQIAIELGEIFPSIIKQHGLRMFWGFKYDSKHSGIPIHADQAAVNVNFWITPEEANRDPEHGGMIIWDAKAPPDWDITKYNGDVAAVRALLGSLGAKPIIIPHRANRAVIFDSDLFHETDVINFKEGYLNRRINITMLYGRRTADGS